MKSAYYNENDPFAAQWLRNLIAAGHIAPGEVDERSILEVTPDDLRGFTQCHFFAGIGIWSHALRSAGWPDTRSVWSGSCPCQPFSAAGKGDEFADERHLWPAWMRLIRECRPESVFGEQVASKDALSWLDHVSTDLEGEGYTFGAVDTCAAGFGAPHIRQRLYFVADANGGNASAERQQRGGQQRLLAQGDGVGELADAADERTRRPGQTEPSGDGEENGIPRTDSGIATSGLADAEDAERRAGERREKAGIGPHGERRWRSASDGVAGDMGDTEQPGLEGHTGHGDDRDQPGRQREGEAGSTPTAGFWGDAVWLPCRDGKARPTKPGIFPLAHGAPARVGRLRAYGNAICAPAAAEFVKAFLGAE